ncbi:hypothetical protein EVAR_20646_1 [Eumeta japonica]|uniref:Uncharacterized protein n=1 Tax=Eumeta variegata TaxID=151549 RepID=A0A4C1VAH1_EUMVA|nr:hypothetical protein EVAR_20646_1 [Eumeta japonica]
MDIRISRGVTSALSASKVGIVHPIDEDHWRGNGLMEGEIKLSKFVSTKTFVRECTADDTNTSITTRTATHINITQAVTGFRCGSAAVKFSRLYVDISESIYFNSKNDANSKHRSVDRRGDAVESRSGKYPMHLTDDHDI